MKLKNLYLVFIDQLPLKRMWRNFFITGNGRGIFSKHSHVKKDNTPKVTYNSKKSAINAANNMEIKYPDSIFRAYKCLWCDGYHVGKNRKL